MNLTGRDRLTCVLGCTGLIVGVAVMWAAIIVGAWFGVDTCVHLELAVSRPLDQALVRLDAEAVASSGRLVAALVRL